MSGRVPKASGLDMRNPVKCPYQFYCPIRGWKTLDTLKGHLLHTPTKYQTKAKFGESESKARRGPIFAFEDTMVSWVYLGQGLQMELEKLAWLCVVGTFLSRHRDQHDL